MKIKIKVDCSGSEDGCRIQNFKAGMEYDITDKLAKSFIKRDLAIDKNSKVEEVKELEETIIHKEETEGKVKEEEIVKEEKGLKKKMLNSYENKAIKTSPKNKNENKKTNKKIKIKIKKKKGKK